MTTNLSTPSLPSLVHSYLPPSLHPFLTLSYPIYPHSNGRVGHFFLSSLPHGNTMYDKGPHDVYFVAFCAVGFTVLRSVMMNYVFEPFASYMLARQARQARQRAIVDAGKGGTSNAGPAGPANGEVMSKRERRKRDHIVLRFAEQSWSCLYCTTSFTLGLMTLYQHPSPTSPEQLWGTYPYTPISALSKFYYLAQLGWWFHQIFVINTEKRRKDHWQMFGHHILTIALMTGSYAANLTRIGVLIHVLMDLCDIWLPLAKMFRYLGYSTLCDLTFILFLLSWLVSRQIGLSLVIRSAYSDAPKHIHYVWDPPRQLFFTRNIHYAFMGMLSVLWVLASVWFVMAVNVAVRVVRGLGAEDSRSDDEDEDSEASGESGDLDVLDEVPQSVGTGGTSTESVPNQHQLRKRNVG